MPWSIKLHLILGCTPATPEFPKLSVWNNPPRPPPQPTSSSPQCSFPFTTIPTHFPLFPSLHLFSYISTLSSEFSNLITCLSPLSVFCFFLYLIFSSSAAARLSFLSSHNNKRAVMVRGLKLNKLCPTALNTQTGCSQNIKKPQTPKKRREEGLDKTIAQIKCVLRYKDCCSEHTLRPATWEKRQWRGWAPSVSDVCTGSVPTTSKNSPSPHINLFNPHRKQGDLHCSVSTQPPDTICR